MDLQTMTVKEFANFVGVKIGTVYKWNYLKKIPAALYRKINNRKLIFIKNEVENWLEAGAQFVNFDGEDMIDV